MRLLKRLEFIGKRTIVWRRDGIPPGIWQESTVKEVEAAQIFDFETAGEIVSQFDRCKLVKAKCDMSAVAGMDLTSVPEMILFQLADFLDRIYKGRWSAANRTNRRYEISPRDTRRLF